MITPDFLEELDRFDTSRKRNVSALFQGEQETAELGEGLTFSDYRRYSPGDDPRLIDWKLYARTDELYIKQYEEERNFTVHVLVDASGSMDFGDGDANKFDYAAKLGLGFAYLTAEDHNDFRFTVFTDEFDRLDGGQSNRGEILQIIDRCNETDLEGETDFATTLEEYASTIHSRSLVLIASDFLGDTSAIDDGLEALARNEVILAHVIAPEERDPPARGDTIFQGLEREVSRRVYFGGRLEQTYRNRLEQHVNDIADLSRELGMRHEVVDTGADFFDSFETVWIE